MRLAFSFIIFNLRENADIQDDTSDSMTRHNGLFQTSFQGLCPRLNGHKISLISLESISDQSG